VRGSTGWWMAERYCIDILSQISAIQAALDKVALGLLDDHARHCVMGANGHPCKTKRFGRGRAADSARLIGFRADRRVEAPRVVTVEPWLTSADGEAGDLLCLRTAGAGRASSGIFRTGSTR
jgi:hypothetical protein